MSPSGLRWTFSKPWKHGSTVTSNERSANRHLEESSFGRRSRRALLGASRRLDSVLGLELALASANPGEGGVFMSAIDEPDFLTNRSRQLAAVHELAHLRSRLADLQSELLNRMHERRQIIQRVGEQDLARQRESGRASRTAALQRARASEEVRAFDQNVAALRDKIRRLEIDIEAARLSIEVAVAGGSDRAIGIISQRGAA